MGRVGIVATGGFLVFLFFGILNSGFLFGVFGIVSFDFIFLEFNCCQLWVVNMAPGFTSWVELSEF